MAADGEAKFGGWIRRVKIQNFKTFRDPVGTGVVCELDEGVNTLVGANGSGKSNFVSAIAFVLGIADGSNHLKPEDRRKLLYNQGAQGHQTASVEIVFDNTTGRFPSEHQAVVLRRSVGAKKDEYFLSGKHQTPAEIASILEAAGFSRTNPFYIVQQGRVDELTQMSDARRLELLKDIAGTKVYDTKREESVKLLKETESKRHKIRETNEYIIAKLKELEGEKAELKQFQKIDLERRAIEYALHEKKLNQIVEHLREVDEQRETQNEQSQIAFEIVREKDEAIAEVEQERATIDRQLQRGRKSVEVLDEEKREALKEEASTAVSFADAQREALDASSTMSELEQARIATNSEIEKTTAQIESLRPEFDALVAREVELEATIRDYERRVGELLARGGRAAQFKSEAERDASLQTELGAMRQQLAEKEALLEAHKQDVVVATDKLAELEKRAADLEEITAGTRQGAGAVGDASALRAQRDALEAQRKEAWRSADRIKQEFSDLTDRLSAAERHLEMMLRTDQRRGLQRIREVVKERKIKGYHGPLIELIDCDEEYYLAVETAALRRGNALFHVVVDTDSTAADLVKVLEQEKAGRVSFMPLNRVAEVTKNTRPMEGLQLNSDEAKPLVDCIRCRPAFKKAVQHIFGRTVLCKNLEVAEQVASKSKVDCITVDGDRRDFKGAIHGGHHDVQHSRLKAHRFIVSARTALETKFGEKEALDHSQEELNRKISKVSAELEQLENFRVSKSSDIERATRELETVRAEIARSRETINSRKQLIAEVDASREQLSSHIQVVQNELGTPLQNQLGTEEQSELEQLQQTLVTLRQQLLDDISPKKTALQQQLHELESALGNRLKKRSEEISEKIVSLDAAAVEARLQELEAAHERAKETLADVSVRADAANASVSELEKTLEAVMRDLTKLNEEKAEAESDLQGQSQSLGLLLDKRLVLLSKREEFERNLRDVGSLHSSEREPKRNMKSNELVAEHKRVMAQLKKFGNVNKKAMDQFVSFDEQRTRLVEREAVLDESKNSIDQLLETLDYKKSEALTLSFKQVARNFGEVFAQLVPNGKGVLTMLAAPAPKTKKRNRSSETGPRTKRARSVAKVAKGKRDADAVSSSDSEGDDESDDAETRSESGIDNYVGVAINVSFGPHAPRNLTQLSGGQKTLVSLALIFAIQKTDPAPFYILDEIDANLDADYRQRVSKYVQSVAQSAADEGKAQFIIPTFHREFLDVSDQSFLVEFTQTQRSAIKPIERREALKRMADIHKDQEEQQH